MTDFRALCAELVDIATAHCHPDDDAVGYCAAVLSRARAALAQPEPQGKNCPGCEGTPVASNSPCAVCGRAQPESQGPMPEVDDILRLAAIIREVDGNHDKSATALAEAILSHPDCSYNSPAIEPEPQGPTNERLTWLWNHLQVSRRQLMALRGENCLDDTDYQQFARSVLKQWGRPAIKPVPQGPTDEELWDLYQHLGSYFSPTEFARTVLARWGHPAIGPVSVSERLPGPEDCDAEGRCWWWDDDDDMWRLSEHRPWLPAWWTHWLPRWALPVPGVEGADG